MDNLYYESNKVVEMIRNGTIPRGSIVRIQHPSGNSEAVRVHGWNKEKGVMVGCNMGWNNSACEWFDLSDCIVSLVEKPKD